MKYLDSAYRKLKISGGLKVIENMEDNKELLLKTELSKIMESRHDYIALKKGKRFRSAFTTYQVDYLEQEFKKCPYIGNAQRKEISTILNISERAIKIWFQNRRMKEKNNKELEVDERNHLMNQKNVELVNNHESILVNDQQRNHLLSLTAYKDSPNDNNICKRLTGVKTEQCVELPKEINFRKEPSSDVQDRANTSNASNQVSHYFKDTKHCYKSSAELSIELYKKYKPIMDNNNKQNKSMSVTNSHVLTKNEHPAFDEQNFPEDLSVKTSKRTEDKGDLSQTFKKKKFESQEIVNQNELEYKQMYVTNHPPYLAAGNVLWRPVNIMPVMPTGASVIAIPSGTSGPQTANQVQKVSKECHCDCHKESLDTPDTAQNSGPLTQYILTTLPASSNFQSGTKF